VIPPGPRLGRSGLTVKGLSKKYGDRTLFRGVDLTVDAGSVVGVVSVSSVQPTFSLSLFDYRFCQTHRGLDNLVGRAGK